MTHSTEVDNWFAELSPAPGDAVVLVIDRILREADGRGASDIHFQPGREAVEVRFRIDGVLRPFGTLPSLAAPQIAARLKVLAHLLTYKIDIPQEGRIRSGRIEGVRKELRISTAPTLYGERVVVRLFASEERLQYLDELGFHEEIRATLSTCLHRTGGVVLISGPAGCGKTTTAYALLRELVDRSTPLRSIVSLEDPVEHAIDGIAQIEIEAQGEMTLARMLKYVVRQDPEVLFVGEIRDTETARTVMQAALTGHLLISTFHAGRAVEAVGRLLEIGIEPFALRSVLSCVVNQRLLRKLCSCARPVSGSGRENERVPVGCPECGGIGYAGRLLIAESLPLTDDALAQAILERRDTRSLARLAEECGMKNLREHAEQLVAEGRTSRIEVERVCS